MLLQVARQKVFVLGEKIAMRILDFFVSHEKAERARFQRIGIKLSEFARIRSTCENQRLSSETAPFWAIKLFICSISWKFACLGSGDLPRFSSVPFGSSSVLPRFSSVLPRFFLGSPRFSSVLLSSSVVLNAVSAQISKDIEKKKVISADFGLGFHV